MTRRRIDQNSRALHFESNRARQIQAGRLIEQMVAAEAKQLGRKALELAMAGNEKSLLFCLDRLFPKRRPSDFKLPTIDSARDLPVAITAIVIAVNDGQLTFEDAEQLARLVNIFACAIKTYDLSVRLEAVEAEIRQENL